LHGGYWRSLSKSDFSFVAPSFVADGAMVVVPYYALCPAVTATIRFFRACFAGCGTVYRPRTCYGFDTG
jgi:arylformamidase